MITPFSTSQARAAAGKLRKFIDSKVGKTQRYESIEDDFQQALSEFVEEFPEDTQAILAEGRPSIFEPGRDATGRVEIPGSQGGTGEFLPGSGGSRSKQKPGTLARALDERDYTENYDGPFHQIDGGAEPTGAFDPGGPRAVVDHGDLRKQAMHSEKFMEENPDFAAYLKKQGVTGELPYGGKPIDMDVEELGDTDVSLSDYYKGKRDTAVDKAMNQPGFPLN